MEALRKAMKNEVVRLTLLTAFTATTGVLLNEAKKEIEKITEAKTIDENSL